MGVNQIAYGSSRSWGPFLEGRAEIRYQQRIQRTQQHGMTYLRRVAMGSIGRRASGKIRGRPIEQSILSLKSCLGFGTAPMDDAMDFKWCGTRYPTIQCYRLPLHISEVTDEWRSMRSATSVK